MESLLNNTPAVETTAKPKASKESKSVTNTKTAPPAYLTEFMDFMVGLPTVYKDFVGDSGKLGGDLDSFIGENQEDIEGTSPFSNKVRASMGRKKINLNLPIVQQVVSSIQSLGLNDKDQDYLLTLGNRESSLNPEAKQGSFRGLYQFNKDSLKSVGITEDDYKNNLVKQHEAALKYKYLNLKILDKYRKYIGSSFKGVPITENGLAAASHLLGAGTVMDWFDGTKHSDRAKKGFVDALGTNIKDYFQLFS